MLFALLRSYALCLAMSVTVCGAGLGLTFLYDATQARTFFLSYVYYWNGLLVGMTGFGALHFARSTFKQQFNLLAFSILESDDDLKVLIVSQLDSLFSLRNKQAIAIPVFVVGASMLYICGYPMSGLPRWYLWVTSSAMFYAGGLMLAYAMYALKFFNSLEKNEDKLGLQENVNIVELENFNLYLSILFLTATVALYVAFRGTLTANFTFTPPERWIGEAVMLLTAPGTAYASVRNLLLYPIVIFLPLSLFASFYMKLVLRRIYLSSIKRKISEIDRLAKPIIDEADVSKIAVIEVRKAVVDLKDKIIENNKVLPMITVKDSPSIALVIIVILQFIWINDAQIKQFFDGLLRTAS
jgi:hypothetical protein